MYLTAHQRSDLVEQSLTEKLTFGRQVIREALTRAHRPVVLYTGGKDSTVLHWLVRNTTGGGNDIPVMIVDHGLHFPETWTFIVDEVESQWNLQMLTARNEDVLQHADELGTPIRVDDLDEENRREVREVLGYTDEAFPYTLDTEVGNHLLKTVALRRAVREHGFDHLFVGIRWDEHEARADEQPFSDRDNPPHTRVHPILPLDEADVWTVMREEGLPTHPLYAEGYRSLDSREAEKLDDRPAWEQELGVGERAGREQDKEGVMEKLRALGYM